MTKTKTTPETATEVLPPAPGFDLAVQVYETGRAGRDTMVRAVAAKMGYQLPVDACDPDLIQRDIAANMRRSVEACLEVGKGLSVLKAACEHGQFLQRLDALGIEARVAQKFMASALKFANAASTPLLKAAGNQTKLFEMLVLDDEQVDELLLTGQTGELKLDDVAGMSVKELRAALREERAERKAEAEVSAAKSKQIDKLKTQIHRIKSEEPDERLQGLIKEATAHGLDAVGLVRGRLREAVTLLTEHGEQHGTGRAEHAVFLAGVLGQVQAELTRLRNEIELPDVSAAADLPEWADEQRFGDASASASTGIALWPASTSKQPKA